MKMEGGTIWSLTPWVVIWLVILSGLLALLMLWDCVFLFDEYHLTTKSCIILDLCSYSPWSDRISYLFFLILRWKD